jgi:hypothetical protein
MLVEVVQEGEAFLVCASNEALILASAKQREEIQSTIAIVAAWRGERDEGVGQMSFLRFHTIIITGGEEARRVDATQRICCPVEIVHKQIHIPPPVPHLGFD